MKKTSKSEFELILEKTKNSEYFIDDSSCTDSQLEDSSFALAKLFREEKLDIRTAMSKQMYLSSFISNVVKSFEDEHCTNLPFLHFGHNNGKVKSTFEKLYLPSIKWWFSAKEIVKYIVIPYANFLYRKPTKNTLYKVLDQWIIDQILVLKP